MPNWYPVSQFWSKFSPILQSLSLFQPRPLKILNKGQKVTSLQKEKLLLRPPKDRPLKDPSSTENVTTETPSIEAPTDTTKATSEVQEIDKSVASTEQPTEGQQASQAIVLVQPVKGKEKKMKKHSFKLDLSKPIVLPNVDISKLKGQALIEFGKLCKAKAE